MLALALPSNSKTCLERVSMVKPSSLLDLIISDEGKKFYKTDTRTAAMAAIDPENGENTSMTRRVSDGGGISNDVLIMTFRKCHL